MTTQIGSKNPKRTVIGYGWPWTVRPGERVDFMVSTESNGGSYRADLVRIRCADNLSDPNLFKEDLVEAPFAGSYAGHHQETHLGSYGEIYPCSALDQIGDFTVQAMVMPTLLRTGVRPRLGGRAHTNGAPVFQDQHLVSRWDNRNQRGWALIIDRNGCLTFVIGDGSSTQRVTLRRSFLQDQWFFVMAVYDSLNGALEIFARHISPSLNHRIAWPDTRARIAFRSKTVPVQNGPLRFAACTDGLGNGQRLKQALCFSGRLDRVRLSAGTLTEEQAMELAGSTIPDLLTAPLLGFWDFGKGIDSIDIHDLSEHHHNGVTVNMPMRAVAGVEWDGSALDWRQRPDHYSAIHFHDDDLYDAEWRSDFSYTIPQDLPSGIYAARLRHDASEDYIPFFVAPPHGQAAARVALLLPTATYTAYTNIEDFTVSFTRKKRVCDASGRAEVVDEVIASGILQDAAHAAFQAQSTGNLGKGIYGNHTDGTLCAVASQRHPNMTIKPKGIQWTLVPDTLIVDWLEQKRIPYDVITDELLHREGVGLLRNYRVLITGNHPEYYSAHMLDAIQQYQQEGGRIMYLGGNGFCWVTSFHDQLPGAIEVRKHTLYSGHWKPHELFHSFDGVRGGFWEDYGRPPQLLVGVGLSVNTALTGFSWEGSAPYRRLPDSYTERAAFIFKGVDAELIGDYGVMGGGAAGQEFDSVSSELGTPPHALHLARADNFPSYVSMFNETYAMNESTPVGDVVYFETMGGGAVFSAGSMTWAGSLSHNDYKNDISRITENVLLRFLDDEPLVYDASAYFPASKRTNLSCFETEGAS